MPLPPHEPGHAVAACEDAEHEDEAPGEQQRPARERLAGRAAGRETAREADDDAAADRAYGRHREAVRNFQEAGGASFIDARLADAHELVPKLDGPFDFVFIDADKDWYTNYAKAVIPKLAVGGCIAAHNVYPARGRRGGGMTGDYYEYVSGLPFLETTVTPGGVAISYKRREK